VLFQQTARLCCLAFSHGVLTYDWRRPNGRKISPTASKSYTQKLFSDANREAITHQLMIPKVELSDEGWYCCVATNDGGYTEKCV